MTTHCMTNIRDGTKIARKGEALSRLACKLYLAPEFCFHGKNAGGMK